MKAALLAATILLVPPNVPHRPPAPAKHCEWHGAHGSRRACKAALQVARWNVREGLSQRSWVGYCRRTGPRRAYCVIREARLTVLRQDGSGTIGDGSFHIQPRFSYHLGIVLGCHTAAHSVFYDGVSWRSP